MQLWFYPNAFAQPNEAFAVDDVDGEWLEALSDPIVLDPAEKTKSVAVCGAEFVRGSNTKRQVKDNLLAVHALVLDVDVWREDRSPFTLEELQEKFQGFRYIIWTTFSSTAACLYWRVVVPLATPLPPEKYKALWTFMNEEVLENTMAPGTRDPARLGFIGSVNSETSKQSYQFHIGKGQRFPWKDLTLAEEEFGLLPEPLNPVDMKDNADWISVPQAVEKARKYFRKVGEDVMEGSRHETLLTASCRLWWDYALPEDEVRNVLRMVNNNFQVPKDESEVEKEIKAGFERTYGAGRVEQPVFRGHDREPVARITNAGVASLARRLKQKKNEKARYAGLLLTKIGKQENFSAPNEVRNATYVAANELANEYWQERPERILDFLLPSLRIQRGDPLAPVPEDHEILSRLRWRQGAKRRQIDERHKEQDDARKRNIETAFAGERDYAYTAAEYREFASQGHKDNQWIVQRGKSYYFFVNGSYKGPFDLGAAKNFAHVLLAPAHDKVSTSYIDMQGVPKDKALDTLVKEYGTFVLEATHALTEQNTTIEWGKMTVGSDPQKRKLAPKFSERVDEWLKLFAGEKYEALLDWMAAATYLDRALVALYLCALTGSGKDLFVNGMARLFVGNSPKGLRDFESGDLEECPVVWADESLPHKWQYSDAISRLKQFVNEKTWKVKKLYADSFVLKGHARLVITSNKPDIFANTKETLTDDELRSVQERVLFIRNISPDAKQYLKALGPSRGDFVTEDELARHALWLRDNRAVNQENRFLVVDPDEELLDTFAISSKSGDRVLDWIYAYCSQRRFSTAAVASDGENLFVVSSMVFGLWKTYDLSNQGIRKRTLDTALSTVGSLVTVKTPKSKEIKAWKIRASRLVMWAQVHELDLRDIVDAIPLIKLRHYYEEVPG